VKPVDLVKAERLAALKQAGMRAAEVQVFTELTDVGYQLEALAEEISEWQADDRRTAEYEAYRRSPWFDPRD
jgi:hypothetical protein